MYEVSPNLGRADALLGTVLLGNENGTFSYDKDYNSSLMIQGQIRKLSSINVRGVNKVIVARNNDSPLLLDFSKN